MTATSNSRITFDRLTVGDKIYVCHGGSTSYETKEVNYVETNQFKYGYSDACPRVKGESKTELTGYYMPKQGLRIFCNEVDAMRYCKAQMMKELFSKIKYAKDAVKAIHDFRAKHFELLNHNWTELQLQKLENYL